VTLLCSLKVTVTLVTPLTLNRYHRYHRYHPFLRYYCYERERKRRQRTTSNGRDPLVKYATERQLGRFEEPSRFPTSLPGLATDTAVEGLAGTSDGPKIAPFLPTRESEGPPSTLGMHRLFCMIGSTGAHDARRKRTNALLPLAIQRFRGFNIIKQYRTLERANLAVNPAAQIPSEPCTSARGEQGHERPSCR
jgi:hypothetical protein